MLSAEETSKISSEASIHSAEKVFKKHGISDYDEQRIDDLLVGESEDSAAKSGATKKRGRGEGEASGTRAKKQKKDINALKPIAVSQKKIS